ncbi:nucleolar protein 14 [Neohortaea acidophila]|uniref:Nucleolar protein 14 n=1 Tax=Neohortaea acidophila TaxID=245834 RepID=A0A6A6PQP5_9PEZI|nr:nucleolar protein 14 [Neohortaea acidophila]KAF2482332.1 nucleolar protein 14 [Neohortaea acidophila]
MPPSQLKRLKTSLREAGITGPPKSKKQKRDSKGNNDRIEKQAKLQHLRDSFNPFELRAPSSRPEKHQHTANGASNGKLSYRDVLHRPGVAKSVGEEMRRAKLLPEMQRRNKVGGLVDRRIGEGDAMMTAEERAEERFAAGFVKKGKAKTLFDLEDSDDEGVGLTHGGKNVDDLPADDFNEDVEVSDEDGELMRRKRRHPDELEDDGANDANESEDEEQPDRKKTKKEVMEEVIAKSKYHKYERQKAKEDDDDLREVLDKGMDDMLALLRGHKAPQAPTRPQTNTPALEPATNGEGHFMNPDRQKLLDGADRLDVDKEYDARLKQLALDAKAKPSDRTKTEEEKAKEEAERLRELEDRRLKRMRGEQVEEAEAAENDATQLNEDDDFVDEAAEFGFAAANPSNKDKDDKPVVHEDEDDFALDEDLIASDSEAEITDETDSDSDAEDEESREAARALEDEEDEFVKDILGDAPKPQGQVQPSKLAYAYPCPRSHAELLDVIKDTEATELPTIIQRIRALHHPSLSATNKEAMADFAAALVEHLSYMGIHQQPLPIAEQVIRHLHSLSRTYPEGIAGAFRARMNDAHTRKELDAGDCVILAAIGSIYPTSDHWHQVVTPAMTLMARWLGMNVPDDTPKQKKGAFLVALCTKYQQRSKRVVPEALRFTLRALNTKTAQDVEWTRQHIRNLLAMAELWRDTSAFSEMFQPALAPIKNLNAKKAHHTLQILLQQSHLHRRPLELHHHRKLPIRTSIPKFEEGFHPDKHYDPDKDRADSKKLQKEYKRERKGALRELRKDANFIAREQLREKRERDAEYERKYRRLVAEVQGEAGHDAKVYEREKAGRKRRG